MGPDISGSFNTQISGPNGTTPAGPAPTTSAPKKTGFSNKDSISAAELAASLSMMMGLNAQTPMIPPPSDNNVQSVGSSSANSAFILRMGDQYYKTCTNILDAWSKSLDQQAEETRAAEKSPAKLAKAEALKKENLGLLDSVRGYADQLRSDNNTQALGTLTSSLMTVGAFIGVATLGVLDASSKMISAVTPQVNFAVSLVTQATSSLAEDFRAQLGLIGALSMGTIINYSTVETIYEKLSGKSVDERVLAEKFGLKTIQLINSNQLNLFIEGMLANKTENGKPLTTERKEELAAALKLIMLASALAAVYKAKTGKITDQEFLDLALARGNMKPEGEIEKQLVSLIKDQIALMSPTEKFKILNALGSYMDSDPKLKSLFDVGNAFDDVNETLSIGPEISKT